MFGSANRASDTPLTARSRFTLASVGKMFTAIAIAQLVEAGKLSLDDTLAKVLPEYPRPDVARRITIRQLLEHRAGLGTLFDDPRLQRGVKYPTQLALASAVAPDTLRFAPGTSWAYSNEGFVVLAAVVERVSGTDFFTYLHDHIFVPAGMTETIVAASIDSVPDRVIGYRSGDGDPLSLRPAVRSAQSIADAANGAGGGYSTARDLFRFAHALATGRLVSPAMRDTITMGRTPLPWDRSTLYGYGFEHLTANGREFYGHGGGGTNAGIDNDIRISADGRWTVIVLSNMDPPAGSGVARAIAGVVAGTTSGSPPAAGRPSHHPVY
jgi:CubicO group peptidase (beta-lactamase class C family)